MTSVGGAGPVVVVVPVHRARPTPLELISWRQCLRVLGRHPIRLVVPRGLELSGYELAGPDVEVVVIDPRWQASHRGYNELKLSDFFYGLFAGYEHLVTYELDSFVFRDDLLEWCRRDFDYIGAPWFEGYDRPTGDRLVGVGNSGFSLRRIPAIRRCLAALPPGFTDEVVRQHQVLAEDTVVSFVLGEQLGLRLASVDDAMRWSFEVRPERLFELCGHRLPTGCHAWWRYNLEFWRPHIEAFGHVLPPRALDPHGNR